MKLSNFIIIAAMLGNLAACSPSAEEVVQQTPEQSTPVVENPPPLEEVKPVPFCTEGVTTNCEIRYCHQGENKQAGCTVVTTKPLPVLNVVCPENPNNGCPPPRPVSTPQQPILNVVCEENPERGCPPNGSPKKEPTPVEEWDCVVGCDTSTGM